MIRKSCWSRSWYADMTRGRSTDEESRRKNCSQGRLACLSAFLDLLFHSLTILFVVEIFYAFNFVNVHMVFGHFKWWQFDCPKRFDFYSNKNSLLFHIVGNFLTIGWTKSLLAISAGCFSGPDGPQITYLGLGCFLDFSRKDDIIENGWWSHRTVSKCINHWNIFVCQVKGFGTTVPSEQPHQLCRFPSLQSIQ